MKKWLRCCIFSRSEVTSSEKVHNKASHTDLANSVSVCPEHSLVENPKEIKLKLDMFKKEFERTKKFRIRSFQAKKEKVIGMDSIPIYKETEGKLVSIGTSKTIVYTDN